MARLGPLLTIQNACQHSQLIATISINRKDSREGLILGSHGIMYQSMCLLDFTLLSGTTICKILQSTKHESRERVCVFFHSAERSFKEHAQFTRRYLKNLWITLCFANLKT